MTDREPVSEQPFNDAVPTPWTEARGRLEEAGTYWLATARPDGRPHVMPVLGVRVDGALCFSAGEASRKGKNLARDPRCVITAGSRDLDLMVAGEAAKVRGRARLHLVAEAYAPKHGWRVTVREAPLLRRRRADRGSVPVRGLRSGAHDCLRFWHGRDVSLDKLALPARASTLRRSAVPPAPALPQTTERISRGRERCDRVRQGSDG